MKNLFFLTALLSLFLASCSSDEPLVNPINTPNAKVPVTINVTSNSEFNELKSVSPNEAGVKSMIYIVYDQANGNYIKHKVYDNNNFGQIKDTLQEGKYRVVFLATTSNEVNFQSSYFDSQIISDGDINFNSAIFNVWFPGEHFYKDFTLDITQKPAQESVVLERITSKIEILPLDIKNTPENLDQIIIFLEGLESQSFSLSKQTLTASRIIHPETSSNFAAFLTKEELMNITKENPISINIFPIKSPYAYTSPYPPATQDIPITVTYIYKEMDHQIQTIIKRTYKLERNKILRLTGNLFSDISQSGTDVSIDNEWKEVKEQSFD